MSRAFFMGSLLYPAIELAWRRRTHPAMALAGGVSLHLLSRIHHTQKSLPLWRQALLGGLVITGVEYGFGLLFNRRYQIWDYRGTPLNVSGQICAPFTLAWCGLSAVALGAMRLIDRARL